MGNPLLQFADMADENLLDFVAAGNIKAFETLVARHHGRFYACVYRWVMHREDAQDIVQDGFLKLWSGAARFQNGKGARFTTWFYRVLYNQSIDRLRDRTRLGGELVEDFLRYEATAEADEIFREEQTDLRLALAELPERQRMAVTLFYMEGLPQKEIAAMMGLSVKALESQLSRAKVALKERMQRHAA